MIQLEKSNKYTSKTKEWERKKEKEKVEEILKRYSDARMRVYLTLYTISAIAFLALFFYFIGESGGLAILMLLALRSSIDKSILFWKALKMENMKSGQQ